VFVESGGTWSQQAELTASEDPYETYFGNSVAVSGSTVIVGTLGGTAYVFGSSGPLFTLSASPGSLSVPQGRQGTSTITITPWNGFSGNVSFSLSGLPKGVTAAFNPNSASSTSTLTLTVSGTAKAGAAMNVIGTSGSLTQITPLLLGVTKAVALTPISLTFGTTEVGDTSDAQKVTLSNNLTTTLTGISYSTTGPFNVSSSTCSTTLNKNKSCTISVAFSPTQAGTATGTLTMSDSANNSPQTVSLTGTGSAYPVYVSPISVDFGDQSVGTKSNPIKVDLLNEGSTQTTVTSVSASGDFAITANYCVDGVKPNSHCYVDVVFSPTQSGALSGALTFVDNATGNPQTASLSGTGD